MNKIYFYDSSFVPDSLEWCNYNFVPKIKNYITCPTFGNINIEDSRCRWCLEMLPYQWHMCCDEKNKSSLVAKGMTEEKAILEIYKTKRKKIYIDESIGDDND